MHLPQTQHHRFTNEWIMNEFEILQIESVPRNSYFCQVTRYGHGLQHSSRWLFLCQLLHLPTKNPRCNKMQRKLQSRYRIKYKVTSDFITYIFIARIDLNNLSQLFSHDSRHTSEQNKSNRFCLHRTDLHIVSFRWFADWQQIKQ